MEKHKEDLIFWLAIGKNPKIGSAGFRDLMATKRDFTEIYCASREDLLALGLNEKLVAQVLFCQKNYDPRKIKEDLDKRGIRAVRIVDKEYPELLKELYDPPAILYVKGEINFNQTMVGLVGSRKPSGYGAQATERLATDLALSGITVVSGMAIGIDTIAQESALNAGGKTIAVLGCGIDQIYPSRNVQLAKRIEENGAIITEFPVGVPPMKFNFPLRNRIISGLSRGVVVTEAAPKSGSLITATSALEQNRDVFAVPGSIFNLNCVGPNSLIKMGAKLVTSADDILEELGLTVEKRQKEPPKGESEEEDRIIKLLIKEPTHIDEISKKCKLETAKLSQVLTIMEISGKVKHVGGMVYRLNV